MTPIFKLSFTCIISALFAVLIKKHSPEFSFLIGIAAIIACAMTSGLLITQVATEFRAIKEMTYINLLGIEILVKCLGISALTQLSCSLCKDAGQGAAACALELAGNLVLLLCMIPLIESLFQIVGDLL